MPRTTSRFTAFAGAGGLTAASCAAPALAAPGHDTLIVVASNPDDAPILSRLPFEHMPAAELDTLASSKSDLLLRRAVGSVAGVFADLSQMTVEQVDTDPILQAALLEGVPIVFTEVGDGRAMRELTGLGLPQVGELEITVVQAVSENRFVMSVIGQDETESVVVSEIFSQDGMTGDARLERSAAEQVLQSEMDSSLIAESVTDLLMDHEILPAKALAAEAARNESAHKNVVDDSSSVTCGSSNCRTWDVLVEFWTGILEGTTSQRAHIEVDFRVLLTDSTGPYPAKTAKIVTIHTGGWFNANGLGGVMEFDSSTHRGYFQEYMELTSEISTYSNYYTDYPQYVPPYPLELKFAEPQNTPVNSTIRADDSFTVGFDSGGSGSASYTNTYSFSTTVPDFEVAYEKFSTPNTPLEGSTWVYDMVKHSSGNYNTWTDLIKPRSRWCRDDTLYGVSSIASRNMSPVIYQRWEINRNYRESVEFMFTASHRIRRIKRTKDNLCGADEFTTWWTTRQNNRLLSLDFDAVHQN